MPETTMELIRRDRGSGSLAYIKPRLCHLADV